MERKTELDFVDEDIAEYFRARFRHGEGCWRKPFPTEMQHARNVRRLAEAIENLTKVLAERLGQQQQPKQR